MKHYLLPATLAVSCLSLVGAVQPAHSQEVGPTSATVASFNILHQFSNPTDGGGPTGRLVRDSAGNLYGASGGGPDNYGVVFKLSPRGQYTVLHSFNGTDGSFPEAGLVRDADGNLYGTTSEGGSAGDGIVFKLTPAGVFTVLHNFHGAPDGAVPMADLLLDGSTLYGTTSEGGKGCSNPYGASGCGTVFKVTTAGAETVVYRFANSPDGAHPAAGLVMDSDGNFYGTTAAGGNVFEGTPLGTVFRVTATGEETVLYRFNGINDGDGQDPRSTLIWGENGGLYGTTVEGGPNGWGTVFRLTRTGAESILYSFPRSSDDGESPEAGVVRESAANLYGTTLIGGAENTGCSGDGCGAVFKLTPNNAESVLHSFTDSGTGGCAPDTALLAVASGQTEILYGSTPFCGARGNGTIFEIQLNQASTVK
ncbi:MAG TPA: choice-of-anchor tandem repeat GloVer-containing protein [Acidobacteriaceae bacterium]